MTKEQLIAALEEAYALLAYATPDEELVHAQQWLDDCDKWLDTYAPSKVKAADEPSAELESRSVTCQGCKSKFVVTFPKCQETVLTDLACVCGWVTPWGLAVKSSACLHDWKVVSGVLDGHGEHYHDRCEKCGQTRDRHIAPV